MVYVSAHRPTFSQASLISTTVVGHVVEADSVGVLRGCPEINRCLLQYARGIATWSITNHVCGTVCQAIAHLPSNFGPRYFMIPELIWNSENSGNLLSWGESLHTFLGFDSLWNNFRTYVHQDIRVYAGIQLHKETVVSQLLRRKWYAQTLKLNCVVSQNEFKG